MEEALASALEFLAAHGYWVVFLWMLADQAALPVPAIPLLVAAGAVSATGDLQVGLVIALAVVATLIADGLWYVLGYRGGGQAIQMVCRLSLEPDSCVTSTRDAFTRYGPATIVLAKYLPGVQTLAPASAGFARVPWPAFLLLDLLGTLLFILPFVLGGYFFQTQLFEIANRLAEITGAVTWLVIGVVALWVGYRIIQWVVFLRGHRLRRLSPEDLKRRLEQGIPTTIIDLRQAFDYQLLPRIIPGAIRIPLNEIPDREEEIPRAHDIVLVCT